MENKRIIVKCYGKRYRQKSCARHWFWFQKNIGAVNREIGESLNSEDASVNINANVAKSGGGLTVYQTNNYKQAYTSPVEKYKSKQQLYAAARLIKAGAI